MSPVRSTLAVAILVASPAVRADEYRDLFDGKTLEGWVVDGPAADKEGKPVWAVRDGMIVAS
jgi:hypothetical protein